MAEREPLPGWGSVCYGGWASLTVCRWPGQPLEIAAATDGRFDLMPGFAPIETGGNLRDAQLSAEDAAIALVREMAGALGLTIQADPCRWTDAGTHCPGDYPTRLFRMGCSGLATDDFPGAFCDCCGGRVVVDESEGVGDE